jgi:large subunit ribosomal protein L25
MADNVALQANERGERGKNAARRLRASGMTPAVLYGDGESTSLAVETRTLDYTLTHYGDNALYDIDLGSGSSTARVVDAHRDPVTGLLVHVDFAPVNMREKIEVTVPLAVVGEAAGAEEGGVLQQVAYEIQVETLPGDIPQEITLDVTPLGMNENLTLGDLTLPEGVELLSDPEEVAATVTQPTEITDEEMEAAGIVEEETDEEIAAAEAAEGEETAEGDEVPSEENDEGENG